MSFWRRNSETAETTPTATKTPAKKPRKRTTKRSKDPEMDMAKALLTGTIGGGVGLGMRLFTHPQYWDIYGGAVDGVLCTIMMGGNGKMNLTSGVVGAVFGYHLPEIVSGIFSIPNATLHPATVAFGLASAEVVNKVKGHAGRLVQEVKEAADPLRSVLFGTTKKATLALRS